jgi:hypothetical protein
MKTINLKINLEEKLFFFVKIFTKKQEHERESRICLFNENCAAWFDSRQRESMYHEKIFTILMKGSGENEREYELIARGGHYASLWNRQSGAFIGV